MDFDRDEHRLLHVDEADGRYTIVTGQALRHLFELVEDE
jgi:hypothetical protein